MSLIARARKYLATNDQRTDEARHLIGSMMEHIQLHAGDTLSLSNELDEWRARALEAEGKLYG